MKSDYKYQSSKKSKVIIQGIVSIAVFLIVSLFIRIPLNGLLEGTRFMNMLIPCGIMLAILFSVFSFSKAVILNYLVYMALYLVVPYSQVASGTNVGAREMVSTLCFGTLLFIAALYVYYLSQIQHANVLRRTITGVAGILYGVGAFIPLGYIGYYVLSGKPITADIVLTLFQTNPAEALAYVRDKGIIAWSGGMIGLILSCALLVWGMQKSRAGVGKRKYIAIAGILILIGIVSTFPKTRDFYIFRMVRSTTQVLHEYQAYGEAKKERQDRLQRLQNLTIAPNRGGVYVLVIGESETRDHMHAYGYGRETTPWLDSTLNQKGTLLFTHAYSNHTHTVPTLTYALSEKNQYNAMNLSDAYSIMEAAKAAGYTTYWISNQQKYGAWDTPIAEIASTADHEVWLNHNVGTSVQTSAYDEQVVDTIPAIPNGENAFIVIHLMGCHGSYTDRFPESYRVFSGKNPTVDDYDNAVRYNDYVLHSIYDTVKREPGFQGMIYFSDHGEDADHGYSHESTKFTWKMGHIPLIMWFSPTFMKSPAFTTLQSHRERYWTNDLAYNMLLTILGIQGMPNEAEQVDLASPQYTQNQDSLLILHGKRKLSEDTPQS